MSFQGEIVHNNRVSIKELTQSGYSIKNDLTALYFMTSYLSKYANLSKVAKQRIKWFDYYRQCNNVAKTCRYFGISRKTFYKWQKVYNPDNLNSLKDRSTAPIHRRQPQITFLQEQRLVKLRKKYICWSKIKIAKVYERFYKEKISSWQVQRVIQKYKLYRHPAKIAKTTKKRLKAVKKKRIACLKKKPKPGFLICLDAIELRRQNLKRFIFTAIDHYSKVGFAMMYKRANSYNAADFLNRLLYLLNGKIENIQTDNGSEFEKLFAQACVKMNLDRYYNRPHTPKDNSVNERFNRTLQDEFVSFGNFTPNTQIFNKKLTEWLIEYNFIRPHQTLDYETPIPIAKVSPMYPSYTSY